MNFSMINIVEVIDIFIPLLIVALVVTYSVIEPNEIIFYYKGRTTCLYTERCATNCDCGK